ncbi:type III secretory pathway component EscV [Virgibacillus halotolerans]|uniref:hypothetical protein n=1 Tax=Virgibacillus halotolerans TaxID=1071053 RepID=UPI0019604514|nr:hypothetical protein [Virgibacillus halotolerans]MBM7597689.1 type III secretory pathway component EscV [Virgibacillus halotolerans]
MIKKGFIIKLMVVVALGIGVYSFFHETDQTANAERTDEKQKESATKESKQVKEQKSEAREKIEQLSDEETIALIKKGRKANRDGEEVTQEETKMLKAITQDEFYNLMGMSDKSVLGTVDAYHQSVNSQIFSVYQEESDDHQNIQYADENKTSDKEAIIPYKKEFEWINENYDFGNEYYNESINEILKLMDEYDEGNQDALLSLKTILYELNEEYNPETLDRVTAYNVSLEDVERIKNGEEPKFEISQP